MNNNKCLLEKIETINGIEYDCGYENAPTCDECIYGIISTYGGLGINPETGKKKYVKKEEVNERGTRFRWIRSDL